MYIINFKTIIIKRLTFQRTRTETDMDVDSEIVAGSVTSEPNTRHIEDDLLTEENGFSHQNGHNQEDNFDDTPQQISGERYVKSRQYSPKESYLPCKFFLAPWFIRSGTLDSNM